MNDVYYSIYNFEGSPGTVTRTHPVKTTLTSPDNNTVLKDGSTAVFTKTGKPTTLNISIVDGGPSGKRFLPCGVSVQRRDAKPISESWFSSRVKEDDPTIIQLTIKGNAPAALFDFVVLFQDHETSLWGLLDPMISNDQ